MIFAESMEYEELIKEHEKHYRIITGLLNDAGVDITLSDFEEIVVELERRNE